jgi:hypothetical protein
MCPRVVDAEAFGSVQEFIIKQLVSPKTTLQVVDLGACAARNERCVEERVEPLCDACCVLRFPASVSVRGGCVAHRSGAWEVHAVFYGVP